MKKVTSLFLSGLSVCLVLLATGCSKGNIFSWAHQSGSSGSTPALSSDAYTALLDKDYDKALEYYKKILESNPSDSEAIYGYSVASLADAGLDISSLVANLIKQPQAPSGIGHLTPALEYVVHARTVSNLLPQPILDRLDTMSETIDAVLAANRLPRIVKGNADGKIDPDNPDVNINIAFCLILRAAIRVQQSGLIEFGNDYTIRRISTDNNLRLRSDAIASAKDIASAYQRIRKVVVKLKLADGSTLKNIEDKDIEPLFNDLKRQVEDVTHEPLDVYITQDYL